MKIISRLFTLLSILGWLMLLFLLIDGLLFNSKLMMRLMAW